MHEIKLPLKGLGTYKLTGTECTDNVLFALENGIELIDTASFYENEEEIGKAISNTKVPRESFKVTTKMWTDEMRKESARDSLLRSLYKLKTDYVDFYLVHWPVNEKWLDAYEQMLELQQEGLIKSVGVCNLTVDHLITVKDQFGSFPALNQVESHPVFQQKEMRDFCKKNEIQMQSWRTLMNGEVGEIEELKAISAQYHKTAYQVALKFFVQNGIGVIPKSSSQKRILNNFDLDDFTLSALDLKKIEAIDKQDRRGPHPNNFDF